MAKKVKNTAQKKKSSKEKKKKAISKKKVVNATVANTKLSGVS